MLHNKYGVFIPTYNATRDLRYFQRNLEILQQLSDNYQVLFIDSSSRDNTVDLIHQANFECHVIPQIEFDHGKTRQLAAEILSDCEVIIYLTQDAELTGIDSIYALVAAFDDPLVATAFGRQLPHRDADVFAAANRAFNYPEHSYQRSYADRVHYGVKCVFSSDSYAAYRRSVLFAVGGFPNHVIVSEDMLVTANMLKSGYKIAYVAKASCFHSHNYTLSQEFSRYFDIGVFFAYETWIKQEFGSAEGEGKKAILQQAKSLFKFQPWLLPSFVVRVLIRALSYKLGANYAKLPGRLVKKISAQKQFWNK